VSNAVTILEDAVVEGDKIDMEGVTVDAVAVKRSRVVNAGTTADAIADVIATIPSESAYGLVVRALTSGNKAHGAIDSTTDSPVKIGAFGHAGSYMDGAVSNGDRTHLRADRFGRLYSAHIDPNQFGWKAATYTTTQTGTSLWAPHDPLYRIAVTHVLVSIFGTTAGRLTLWFGASADTTYTEGTDQVIVDLDFVPSATIQYQVPIMFPHPVFSAVADDDRVKVTTSANLSVRLSVGGYLFKPTALY
jgi:hypothetical protein